MQPLNPEAIPPLPAPLNRVWPSSARYMRSAPGLIRPSSASSPRCSRPLSGVAEPEGLVGLTHGSFSSATEISQWSGRGGECKFDCYESQKQGSLVRHALGIFSPKYHVPVGCHLVRVRSAFGWV